MRFTISTSSHALVVPEPMSLDGTFIDRYGHVQYKPGHNYRATRCDMPLCFQSLRVGRRYGRARDYRTWSPVFVTDHCHNHGWIRGFLCQSCNIIMRDVDKTGSACDHIYNICKDDTPPAGSIIYTQPDDPLTIVFPSVLIPAETYIDYRDNCPDCARVNASRSPPSFYP